MKGIKFNCTRDDWTCYDNMENMCNVVYGNMVEAGIGVKLDEAE